jgi:hypothetical protein
LDIVPVPSKRPTTRSSRMTAIFCKVENWSRNGLRVELMLYAGNNLDKARRVFERTHRKRTTTSMRTIS